MENEREYFSDEQIVARPGFRGLISRSGLQKLRVRGGGPRYLKLGKKVFYTEEWMREWLNGQVVNSTSDRAA